MKVDIEYSPSFAIATLGLDAGEAVRAEAGAMVAMSSNIGMETKAEGGMLGGLKWMALGGESFFINTCTAEGGPGDITVGPSLPGDVLHLPLAGDDLRAVRLVSRLWDGDRGRHQNGAARRRSSRARACSC